MAISQDDRSLLARIAFFLCRDGQVDEAEAAFRGLADSAPERSGPTVGLALCRIIKGDNQGAVDMIDARLNQPEADLKPSLNLYKLVALIMDSRMGEAETLLREMRASADCIRVADAADQIFTILGAKARKQNT